MKAVPPHRLDLRLIELEKRLEPWGDIHYRDAGRNRRQRIVRIRVESPGYGLPVEAVFEYSESYARTREGWVLTEYAYEYRPQPPPLRLAHHFHEPFGAHRHCVDGRSPGDGDHYTDYPVVLEQAHEEFAALAARQMPIKCADLGPLEEPHAGHIRKTVVARRRR